MANPFNLGTLSGNLTADPVLFAHAKDGSHTVVFTVASERDYVSKATGERESDFIQVEDFIKAGTDPAKTPYASIFKGDTVHLQTTMRSSKFEKNGKTEYRQVTSIESMRFGSTRKASQDRRASRATQFNAAAAAAEATNVAPVQPVVAQPVAVHTAPVAAVQTTAFGQAPQTDLPFAQA